MAQYTREQIRNFIRCPQLGSTDYGEWGALRLEQRLAIKDLLDQLDSADAYIEKLGEENKNLDNLAKTMMNNCTKALEDTVKDDYIPKSVVREKIDNRRMKLGKYRTYYYKDDCGLMVSVNSEIQIELELLLEELLGDEL